MRIEILTPDELPAATRKAFEDECGPGAFDDVDFVLRSLDGDVPDDWRCWPVADRGSTYPDPIRVELEYTVNEPWRNSRRETWFVFSH